MTDDTATGERLAPDDAFSALGNETRIDILRALGDADPPLSFSELYDRIDIDDSSQFNYHLDRMVDHFVERDDGYRLTRAGQRVVEAVLSGSVTESPEFPRTEVDASCPYCDGTVEIRYGTGGVEHFCRDCDGRYGTVGREDGTARPVEGYLGRNPFPPAGVQNRTPDEVLEASWVWGTLEVLTLSSGICPRCSATVEWSHSVCSDHDTDDGLCSTCEGRYAVSVHTECTNCIFAAGGEPVNALAANTDLLALLTAAGRNPVNPDAVPRVETAHGAYEERVHETNPLRAEYIFEAGGDRLALTVDDNLEVVETVRSAAAE